MLPYLMMIMVVVFYAGNILVGESLNDLPPLTIAFARLGIAFLCLAPLATRTAWRSRRLFLTEWRPLLLLTLTGVAFFNTFIYAALQFTSSTNVSVLETLIPALTLALSALVLREKLHRLQWAGVAVSICGALWVITDGQILDLTGFAGNLGDAIMLGAVASWAVYSIAVTRYLSLFPTFSVLLVMTGLASAILAPLVVLEWVLLGVPSLTAAAHIPGLVYLGVFPGLIALLFYNRAVQQLGAARASVFLNFLPVATMIGAVLWLDAELTPANDRRARRRSRGSPHHPSREEPAPDDMSRAGPDALRASTDGRVRFPLAFLSCQRWNRRHGSGPGLLQPLPGRAVTGSPLRRAVLHRGVLHQDLLPSLLPRADPEAGECHVLLHRGRRA